MVRADTLQERPPAGSRIAVIGSGLSGLTAAHFLSKAGYDVVLMDRAPTIGMDDNSCDYVHGDKRYRVDVPFRSFSAHYYVNLHRLYKYLGVDLQNVNYSYSIRIEGESKPYFQYFNVFGVPFMSPSVLLSRRFWVSAMGFLRYSLTTPAKLRRGELQDISLEADMQRRGFSKTFYELSLLPLLSTMFSCSYNAVRSWPAENVAYIMVGGSGSLFASWRRVKTGVETVVEKLLQTLPKGNVRSGVEVQGVQPTDKGVVVTSSEGMSDTYSAVVLALEAPAALKLLGKHATPEERAALSAFTTHKSGGLVHSDPRAISPESIESAPAVVLTAHAPPYDDSKAAECTMRVSHFLGMPSDVHCFQTWNPNTADPPQDLGYGVYRPVSFVRSLVTVESERVVREEMPRLQGKRNVWFCGSYCSPKGVTLLEQATTSGLDVARDLGATIPFEVSAERRVPSLWVAALSEGLYYGPQAAWMGALALCCAVAYRSMH
eukprot:PhM_4_TR13187/c0_g2_i1/m.67181